MSWSCGDQLTDTRNSKTYPTVQINSQCWIAENLDYDNGCSSNSWTNGVDTSWCGYYSGGPYPNEGLLYQWSAAMNGSTTEGAQGICPSGWHVPTDEDFRVLFEGIFGSSCETPDAWACDGVGSQLSLYTMSGNNSTGFSGLLSGYRNGPDGNYNARIGSGGNTHMTMWTSTLNGSSVPYHRFLWGGGTGTYKSAWSDAYAYSIRCLKN